MDTRFLFHNVRRAARLVLLIILAGLLAFQPLTLVLAADGDLDTSFDSDGKVTTNFGGSDAAYAVAVQPDGKIVVGGYPHNGSNYDFGVARYNSNGSLDTTFHSDGIVTTPIGSGNDLGYGIAIQSDGKIVVAGLSHNGSNYDFAVVRYNTDGTLDTTFHSDGIVTTPIGSGDDGGCGIAIQSDGKIVVAGYSYWTLDKSQVEQGSDLHFNRIGGIIEVWTFKRPHPNSSSFARNSMRRSISGVMR